MEDKRECLSAIVRGRVQGVGFRYSTLYEARRLGLTGYVRNLMDGSVEVVAEGGKPSLEALAGWLRRGPSLSYVSGLEINYSPASGQYKVFTIK